MLTYERMDVEGCVGSCLDADERRPRDLDTVAREMTEGLRRADGETGVDPALIQAWCELGYVVTETPAAVLGGGYSRVGGGSSPSCR